MLKNAFGSPLIDTQKSDHFELTGNPIRKILLEPDQEYDTASIYITGGSQGANYLNDVIPKALNKVNHRIRVVHQAGKGSSELVINTYLKNKFDLLVVKDFFDDPFVEIQKADFVISRSGALSVSEITSLNKEACISLYIIRSMITKCIMLNMQLGLVWERFFLKVKVWTI